MLSEFIARNVRSQEIRNSGISLFNQGHYFGALQKFEESLTINSQDIKTLQYRGMCKCLLAAKNTENQQQIENAISDFKKVLEQIDFVSQQTLQLL